jgi:general secretion pathway protein L
MPADRDFVASATTRLRDVGRRTGATDFLRWWGGELAALLPSATRSAVRRRRMRPVAAFADDAATFWQPFARGGEIGMDRVARVPLADEVAAGTAGRAAVDALVRANGSADVVVALPPQHVLRRVLTLPEALEENLRQAIAYDLDRHTPFRPDDLYFDAAVAGRDPARGQVRVELATARRAVVDRAVQAVEGWGASVVAVVPDAPDAAAASKLNLLPPDRQPRTGPRWGFWVPLAFLAVFALVALALPIWQKREHAIALLRQVDGARAQAAVSEGLRGELDRLVATYNFALERKFAFPSTLHVLDEVTKLLPDDTWLTQLELKSNARGKEAQRELLLRGESGNAGRLITLFEESKVFSQATPRSPTTKIQPGPGEIFDLVAQVRPLPPPAPVAPGDAPPPEAKPTEAKAPVAAPPSPPPAATATVAPPKSPPATAPNPAAPPAPAKPPAPAPAASAPAPASPLASPGAPQADESSAPRSRP